MKNYLNDEFFGRLETLALNLRTNLTGFFGGKHRTNAYGQTVEFSDYREYQLGDDIRRIDWNLYSRFEKYFIKLFTDERQMHTQIFLDCSASMGKANPQKFAYAVCVAAALGFLSVHNMDKTSFKLIKKDVAEDLCGTIVGKNTFFKAVNDLKTLNFEEEANISAAITSCSNPGQNDGLSVIISDFFADDWKKAVDFLSYKKRQILLIQVLSPDEIEPGYSGRTNLLDMEAVDAADTKNIKLNITRAAQKAYEMAFNEIVDNLKSFCNSRGAGFISIRCDQSIEKAIFGQLLKSGIME